MIHCQGIRRDIAILRPHPHEHSSRQMTHCLETVVEKWVGNGDENMRRMKNAKWRDMQTCGLRNKNCSC